MRSRIIVGALLVASLSAGTVASSGDRVAPTRQWAVAYLNGPTLIGTSIVEGPVLFVHDMDKMARGEPCTTIRLFDPEKGPTEELVSFHCIPRARKVVPKFTMTTRPNVELGFGCILTEYQFAGDVEGHAVSTPNPIPADY